MTGEALPSLWRVIGLLNHPKLHKWRKHSRLKGSQLVVITWYFQDVGPPPSLFSPHILFRNLSTSGVLTRARHLRAVALRSRSDHQCQNCQPVVLAGGGEGGIGGGCEGNWDGRELVSCVFFFFYSTQPPETVREEESDGLVEEKEAAMMCWQLSCLAVKEGNFSRLRRWAVSFFVSHYIFLFCVFFEFVFFFFHYLNSSLSQLCQMIIKMESKVTTLLFQPFFFFTTEFTVHFRSLGLFRTTKKKKKITLSQPVDMCNLWRGFNASFLRVTRQRKLRHHCSTIHSRSVFLSL